MSVCVARYKRHLVIEKSGKFEKQQKSTSPKMMNSYFEQSGFYGSHGQSVGAEQAYRFPLGLGVNPYGPPGGGGRTGVQDSSAYDPSSASAAAAAAAAAASCKLYEQQYKLPVECTPPKDQNGYGGGKDSAISSWAAAAAAAAAAANVRSDGLSANGRSAYGNGVGATDTSAPVGGVAPRSALGSGGAPNSVGSANPWSPCSLNTPTGAGGVGAPQHGVASHHGQHAPSHGQSPQSQSSAHTFYPWMAIAGQFTSFAYSFACPILCG